MQNRNFVTGNLKKVKTTLYRKQIPAVILDKSNLSLGERVHLASKDLKKILTPSIAAAILGLLIISAVIYNTYSSTTTIKEYGHFENRINSANGPPCNPDTFKPVGDSDPAKIIVLNGLGAEKAGIQNNDIILKINNVTISNAADVGKWQSLVPDVKPGDTVNVVVLRNNQQISFNVQTSASESNPTLPFLGVTTPTQCGSFYFLNNQEKSLTLDAIRSINDHLDNITFFTAIFALIFGYFLVWTFWKGRKLKAEIRDWEDAYLDQHYILTFETNTPKGETNGEKILNMAQAVFPELRKKNGKFVEWSGKEVTDDGYEFDCYQTTNEDTPQLFIAKHFEKTEVDLDKLKELCTKAKKSIESARLNKKIKKLKETNIFRIICVAENYDDPFLKDRTLDKIMDELEYPIDLILEKDGNYQVLWVES